MSASVTSKFRTIKSVIARTIHYVKVTTTVQTNYLSVMKTQKPPRVTKSGAPYKPYVYTDKRKAQFLEKCQAARLMKLQNKRETISSKETCSNQTKS